MTKKEFLSDLRAALSGNMPESEVRNQVDYYDLYIANKARTIGEEAATEQLGSPLLIAKTLINDYRLTHNPNIHYDSKGTNTSSTSGNTYYESQKQLNNRYEDYRESGQGKTDPGQKETYSGTVEDQNGYFENGSGRRSHTKNVYNEYDKHERNRFNFTINDRPVNSVWVRLGCLGTVILIGLILFLVAKVLFKLVFPALIVVALIFIIVSIIRGD